MTRSDSGSGVQLLMWIVILLLAVPVANANDLQTLNVSIAAFDPGVPDDQSLHRDLNVFPRIREIESRLIPFVLREALANANEWGAVRVVPEPDVAAELLITGAIVRSDGEALEFHIRAVDASGRIWLDKAYAGVVTSNYAQSDDESGVQGNRTIFDEVATDLQNVRVQLGNKALTNIVAISLLRYATELAPTAFAGFLDQADDGTFIIQRLPARNDPMIERIERIRGAEYVITDAVDAKYQELHDEIASVYDMWREYRRKVVAYQTENASWVQRSKSDAPRGSYEAIVDVYDNYKLERITAQRQDSLAVAFNNEVSPTVAAMEARVAELEGWVDEQYAEWNRLLEELFEVETRLEQ